MNFNTRVRLYDKENKIMLPTAPLYKTDFYHCLRLECFEIMFETGLRDKNSKRIYSDDILEIFHNEDSDRGYFLSKALVFWSQDELCWRINHFEGVNWPITLDNLNEYIGYEDDIEIIGNVWENPEYSKENLCANTVRI